MKIANFYRKGKKAYIYQLTGWAKRLGAEEMTVHTDGSVTLMCESGCICDRYNPQAKELSNELPSRYWEPQPDGPTEEEIDEAQEWLEQNGIPYDPELPFN